MSLWQLDRALAHDIFNSDGKHGVLDLHGVCVNRHLNFLADSLLQRRVRRLGEAA